MTSFSQPERRALARSQATQAHPDPDLLNAFSEQTATAREREQVLAHLAVCPSCREVISLAAPPVQEAVPELAPAPSVWKWSILRWGAVATSAVIVVIAVSLGTFDKKTAPTMQVATETTSMNLPAASTQKAIPEETPASTGMKAPQVRYEKVAPKLSQNLKVQPAVSSSNAMLNKVAPPPDSFSGGVVGGMVASVPMPATQEQAIEAKKKDDAVGADKPSNEKETTAKLATAPPPPPPQSPGIPAKAMTPSAPSETVNVASEAVTVELAPAAPPATSAAKSRYANDMQKASPMAARDMRMNALSLDQRWQVTPEGYLLSSTDEGKNWVRQLPDLRFTHVQTVGPHIWASGPDGVLMHSLDGGMKWNKVTPTDGNATLQGDITSIVFSDIDHGTLKTSKNETWITSDAGKSWKKQ